MMRRSDESFKKGLDSFHCTRTKRPDGLLRKKIVMLGVLSQWTKPFITCYLLRSVTGGGIKSYRSLFRRKGQAHTTIINGGHFLQEDQGVESS
jgi:haloalkane dehalogenase